MLQCEKYLILWVIVMILLIISVYWKSVMKEGYMFWHNGRCKHEFKEKVAITIEDWRELSTVDVEGKNPIIFMGRYEVYRCLDCKCLVWEVKK